MQGQQLWRHAQPARLLRTAAGRHPGAGVRGCAPRVVQAQPAVHSSSSGHAIMHASAHAHTLEAARATAGVQGNRFVGPLPVGGSNRGLSVLRAEHNWFNGRCGGAASPERCRVSAGAGNALRAVVRAALPGAASWGSVCHAARRRARRPPARAPTPPQHPAGAVGPPGAHDARPHQQQVRAGIVECLCMCACVRLSVLLVGGCCRAVRAPTTLASVSCRCPWRAKQLTYTHAPPCAAA
jgi:hypothetical protein